MEKILTAVPYPMTSGPDWGIICTDHPTWLGNNEPTDHTRVSAEAYAEAVACGHVDHYVPGTQAEWRQVDPVTGERHLFTWDGRNLSVEAGAPDPGPFPPETAVNAVIVAAMLEHRYNPRYDDSKWAQWCDMTPVVHRAECLGQVNEWGDSWVVEVQYSSKGGRAVYGVNRDHVPSCYMD